MVLDTELALRAMALLAHAWLIASVPSKAARPAAARGLLAALILLAAADGMGAHLLLAGFLQTTGVANAKPLAGAIFLGAALVCALCTVGFGPSALRRPGVVALGLILALGAVSAAGDFLRFGTVIEEAAEMALVLTAGTAMRRAGNTAPARPSRR